MLHLPRNWASNPAPIRLFITDSTGVGVGSLAFGTSGLVIDYSTDDGANWTTITKVTATVGTYTSGGFIAGTPTGWYWLGLPTAALTEGSRCLVRWTYNSVSATAMIQADLAPTTLTAARAGTLPTTGTVSTFAAGGNVNTTQFAGQAITAAAPVTIPASIMAANTSRLPTPNPGATGGLPILDANGLVPALAEQLGTNAQDAVFDQVVSVIDSRNFLMADDARFENYDLSATRFLTMIEADGGVYRYTANALEQGPSGSFTGPTVEQIVAGVVAASATLPQMADAAADEVEDTGRMLPAVREDVAAILAKVNEGGGGGSGTGNGDVLVDQDYGGVDSKRIFQDDGVTPADNVLIRAYVAADLDANVIDPTPPATYTGSDGRWVYPLMLDADDYAVITYNPATKRAKRFALTVT